MSRRRIERPIKYPVLPIPALFTGRCACSPWNFCLLHYSMLSSRERSIIRKQAGIKWAKRGKL